MHKRGQITTFIVAGIIVLVIVAMTLYLRRQLQPLKVEAPPDVAPVQRFVEGCLHTVGEEGILKNSLQGGYYKNFDQQALSLPGMIYVPVYFNGVFLSVPTEEKIRKELGNYVADNLNSCIGDFKSLQGFSIVEEGNLSITNMILGENKVSVEYDYPLKINNKTELRKFLAEYDFRLGKIYNTVKQLLSESVSMPTFICLSCIVDAGIENDLTFETIEWGEYVIVVVKDATTKKPLNFAYAIKLMPREGVPPIPAAT